MCANYHSKECDSVAAVKEDLMGEDSAAVEVEEVKAPAAEEVKAPAAEEVKAPAAEVKVEQKEAEMEADPFFPREYS